MDIKDFSYYSYSRAHPELDSTQAFRSYISEKEKVDYATSLIENTITKNSERVVSSVSDAASRISGAVENAANAICGSLAGIGDKLDFLNRQADMIIEQQNLTNMLLSNIADLLKIPNSEKERQHEISLGVKFLAQASSDPDLFEDALEHLLKAEDIQRQDYFVLHRIGMIYLYSVKFYDPQKAYEYFVRAAKYAKSERDPNAARLANMLASRMSSYASTLSQADKIKMLAADSFEKAAFAAYVTGNIENAIENQKSAYEYCGSGENQFFLAKYLAHNGNLDDSLEHLESAIDKIPNLAAAVFQERDMIERPEIIDFVTEKNDDMVKQLSEMYKRAPSDSVRNYIQTALDGSYAAKRTAYRRLSKRM